MTFERLLTVISLPILAFSDYYLTLLGKKSRDKKYSEFMKTDDYELNPVWQKDIKSLKLFNYKHVLIVFLLTVYFYFSALLMSVNVYDFFYGAVSMMYLFIIARHVQNLLQYSYTAKNPGELEGNIKFSYIYIIKTSQYQTFLFALLILAVNIKVQSWYLLGGTFGLIILSLIQYKWIRRFKKKKQQLMMQNQQLQHQREQMQQPAAENQQTT